MRREILNLLACPNCHGELEIEETAGNYLRVTAAIIRCPQCGAKYPVSEGIADFRGDTPLELLQEPDWADEAITKEGRDRVYDAYWIALPEEVRRHGPRMIRDLARLALPKSGVILDVGTGAGTLLEEILKNIGRTTLVVGIDHSLSVTRATRAHLLRTGRYGPVSLVVCDVRRLPFKDEVFAAACSFAGYQEVQSDPARGVIETYRTLKKSAPIAFGATVVRENSRTAALLAQKGLERIFVARFLRDVFNQAGFVQVHFRTYLSGTWPGNQYEPVPLAGDWYGHGILTGVKPMVVPVRRVRSRTVRRPPANHRTRRPSRPAR